MIVAYQGFEFGVPITRGITFELYYASDTLLETSLEPRQCKKRMFKTADPARIAVAALKDAMEQV